jgi:hypothetical protein
MHLPGAASGRVALVALAAATAADLALRLSSARGALWFDEIWSLHLALDGASALDAFTWPRIDNNHPLNTAWMFLLGPDADALVYRLPAVLAGVALVPAAAWACWRHGAVARTAVAALVALSFPFVVAGSEARGHSLMLLAAAVAWGLLDRRLAADAPARETGWSAAGRAAVLLAGAVAHLQFCLLLPVFAVWSFLGRRRQAEPRAAWRLTLADLGPGAVLCAAWTLWFATGLRIGGGQERGNAEVLLAAASLAGGGPSDGAVVTPVGLAVAAGVASMAAAMARRDAARGIALAFATCGLPLLLLVSGAMVFERYLLASTLLAYFLAAETLARVHAAGGWRRPVAWSILVTSLAAHAAQDSLFARHGRGDPEAAVRLLASEDPARPARVATDHAFRVAAVLSFHARRLGLDGRLSFVDPASGGEPPDWLVTHLAQAPVDPPRRRAHGEATYELVSAFRHHGPSGFDLHVHHRIGAAGRD